MKNIYLFIISILRYSIGIGHRILWLKPYFFKNLLALLSAFIVFYFISIPEIKLEDQLKNLQNYGYLTEFLAVLILILSLVKIINLVRNKVVFEKQDYIKYLPQKNDLYNEVSSFDNYSIIYNKNVNQTLNSGTNPIFLEDEYFEIHPLIHEMLPLFIFKLPEANYDTSDDKKLRLNSDIDTQIISNNQKINLQKTSYFRDRLSNTLANYKVNKNGRVIFDLREQDVLTKDKYLYSLVESKLSNQLGGSVILFTSDSAIVLLKQGNRSSENPGKLAPSGSGSFDYVRKKDIEQLTFQELSKSQVCRELVEECGLTMNDIHNIQICGFGRYLYRNGKPEVFCVASTKKSANEIKIPIRELDYHQKEVEIVSFQSGFTKENIILGLEKLIHKIENKENEFSNCSGVLYWNVIFARDYIENISNQNLKKLFDFNHQSNNV